MWTRYFIDSNANIYCIAILDEVAKIDDVINRNEDFMSIISILLNVTSELLGLSCAS